MWKVVAICCMAVAGNSIVHAEDTKQGNRQPGLQTAPNTTNANQQLAECLYYGCRNEVEISKFAEGRLKSTEARAFAAKMVKHHQVDCEKLARIAGIAHSDTTSSNGTGESRQESVKPGAGINVEVGGGRPGVDVTVGGARPGDSSRTGIDWATVHRQLANECLRSGKEELEQKKAGQFDACYIGMQIGEHMKRQTELKVLSNYATGELKEQLEQCKQKVATHLKEAKDIMETLEKQK